MVFLGYSSGRGRGQFRRGGSFATSSSFSHGRGRGRLSSDFGGSSFRGRGRGNLKWTNSSELKAQTNPHPSSDSSVGLKSLGTQQTSVRQGGNKVWINSKASSPEGISAATASASVTSSGGANQAHPVDISRRNPSQPLASSKPRLSPWSGELGITSKAGNRVWTKNSSRDSVGSGSTSKQTVPQSSSVSGADKTIGLKPTSVQSFALDKRKVTAEKNLPQSSSSSLGASRSIQRDEGEKSRPVSAKFNEVQAKAQLQDGSMSRPGGAPHLFHKVTRGATRQASVAPHLSLNGPSRPSSFSAACAARSPSKRRNLVWTKPGAGEERGATRKLNPPSAPSGGHSVAPLLSTGGGGQGGHRGSSLPSEAMTATRGGIAPATNARGAVWGRSGSRLQRPPATVSSGATAAGTKVTASAMKAASPKAGGSERPVPTATTKMMVNRSGIQGKPVTRVAGPSTREATTTPQVTRKALSRYSGSSSKAPAPNSSSSSLSASSPKPRASATKGVGGKTGVVVPGTQQASIPKVGTAGATSAPVATKAISRYSRSAVKPSGRAARSATRPISKFSRSSASIPLKTVASHSKTVARFSRTVNRPMKSASSRGDPARKMSTVGQVARYSGAWAGPGKFLSDRSRVRAQMSITKGGRAWGSVQRGRGNGAGAFAGGYGAMLPGRGIGPARRGGRGPWDYPGGRGGRFGAPGRGGYIPLRVAPVVVVGQRYSSGILRVLPLVHPPPHMATRWNPWTGHPSTWKGRGSGRSRVLSMKAKITRFKNRTLIRVRSLAVRESAPEDGAVPASRVSGTSVVPRRTPVSSRSPSAARPAVGVAAKAKTSKFVRSGKHGMAIRRVSSSSVGLPAVTKPVSTKQASSKKQRAAPRTGVSSAASTPGKKTMPTPTKAKSVATGKAKGSSATRTKSSAVRTPVSTAKKGFASAASASASPASSRREALRKKLLGRSRTTRKADVVVAGARATRARTVGRNLTLYRGKSGGAGSVGGDAGSTMAKKVKTEPCLFFCKFGKCSKSEEECPYIHDKSKVAVCRGFLKGNCTRENCPLTHEIQTEKMPVCIYFEKGMCFTPNCPYRHVKVSENAAICPNFAKGYCPDGTACRLRHEIVKKKRIREGSNGDNQGDGGPEKSKKKTASETGGELALASGSRVGGVTSSLLPGQEGKSDGAASRAANSAGSEKEGGQDASGIVTSASSANHVEAGTVEEAPSVGSPERSVGAMSERCDEDDELAGLMPRVPWKRQRL